MGERKAVPIAENPEHDPRDMLVLCANCHAKADRGELSKESLYGAKSGGNEVILQFPGSRKPAESVSAVGNGNLLAEGRGA